MSSDKVFLHFILVLQAFDGYCYNSQDDACLNSNLLQCRALKDFNPIPRNENCDPLLKKDCSMYDFVSEDIANCRLEMKIDETSGSKFQGDTRLNENARCYPEVKSYINVYLKRVVGVSAGNPGCVPEMYGKKFKCGERGSRCVCDSGIPKRDGSEGYRNHKCRCQWFADYCTIPNICSGAESCKSANMDVRCIKGSMNQCVANPKVCGNGKHCVELPDKDLVWRVHTEKQGHGFACILRNIYNQLKTFAPFCDFKVSNPNMLNKPVKALDYCCYNHLICRRKNAAYGGYLFQSRPCYCHVEFRKCLIKQKRDRSAMKFADALIPIVESIKICSMKDSGPCDPRQPATCQKGDLISPSIAHCRVNCKTGPLLPIEIRSCRIRKCVPHHNIVTQRIIDVPHHRESSRCDAVKGLPVTCGFKNTRCVCDGKPDATYFTDRCRCQYWP